MKDSDSKWSDWDAMLCMDDGRFQEALSKCRDSWKSEMVATFGEMSDSASRLLFSVASGLPIETADGKRIPPWAIELLLEAGVSPDRILARINQIRK